VGTRLLLPRPNWLDVRIKFDLGLRDFRRCGRWIWALAQCGLIIEGVLCRSIGDLHKLMLLVEMVEATDGASSVLGKVRQEIVHFLQTADMCPTRGGHYSAFRNRAWKDGLGVWNGKGWISFSYRWVSYDDPWRLLTGLPSQQLLHVNLTGQ
jgi:hypothetical protein